MKVYPVTCSYISRPAVNQFLADEGCTEYKIDDNQQSGDTIPEVAGRVCYMSFANPRPGGTEAYLKNILEKGHGSVLEHSVFGFIITGISRSCSHELVRHRAGFSFSQLSQRYVSHPKAVRHPELTDEEWTLVCYHFVDAENVYQRLIEGREKSRGSKQIARAVLPNCTETKVFVTANARAWRHFLELRGSASAEPEIRALACLLLVELKKLAPIIFGDFSEANGILVSTYRKV